MDWVEEETKHQVNQKQVKELLSCCPSVNGRTQETSQGEYRSCGENKTGKLDEVSSGRASRAWPRFWALSRFTDPSSVVWEADCLRKLKVLS